MVQENEKRLVADIDRIVAGRSISLVGNATSLLQSNFGRRIDAGCVVRINSGIPMRPAAQGRRIDIHCFSTRPSLERNLRLAPWRVRFRGRYLRGAFPIWMSRNDRESAADPNQAFYPLRLWDDLAETLGARPSTGAMVFHMFAALTNADICLFGFDFKASGTYYRIRENRGPHDWDAERDFFMETVEKRGWSIFS